MDEILGLAIINILDKNAQSTVMLTLKFTQNLAILHVRNGGFEMIVFDPKDMIDILDLKSMSYYKIKQGTLQQTLSKYYRLKSADIICEQFNRFINMLKKERKEKTQEKYPWLDSSDERKYVRWGNIR